jgi:hypothetical protein
VSTGVDKPQSLQVRKIVLKGPVSGRVLQASANDPQGRGFLFRQEEEDLSLAGREVMGYAKRRDVADRQETDSYGVLFKELGCRMPCPGAQLDDLLRPPAPTLDQTPTEERIGNQGIARA